MVARAFLRRINELRGLVGLCLALFGLTVSSTALAAWPAAEGSNMQDPKNWPNDPGFAQSETVNGKTVVTGGDWNQWSFIPEQWTSFPGFRMDEVKIGSGMHADEAWTKTVGDRRVIIAVLDSGINWDSDDLVNKFFLNRGELKAPEPACRSAFYKDTDPFDANGDGIFNMLDYAKEGLPPADIKTEADFKAWSFSAEGRKVPKTACDSHVSDLNKNNLLDPEDLILNAYYSDGKDDDGDGYMDNISGWDFFRNDNDAKDDTRYGHGSGEARDSSAEGNNGRGGLGICPECTVLMVRVADSFLADADDFSASVIFATDSGASVVQEALGSMSRGAYADDAINYAYANNTVIIASAADELSFHHNMPGTTDHTVYVHAIVYDGASPKTSTTFLNFNNCTNFGGQLVLSSPGTGCSSEATGVTSGHAGMIKSAGLQAKLDPPMSAEEVRGVLINSVDDIDVPESKTDSTKFPSGPGWDLHFGYGRNNVYKSVKLVLDDLVPPEVDILTPSWFDPIEVTQTPKVMVRGRIGARMDAKAARYASYHYVLEWAKGIDPKSGWAAIKEADTPGFNGDIGEFDAAAAAASFDFNAPLIDHDQYSLTLRLRVTAKNKAGKEVSNEFRKSVGLYKDPDLLPGFPKHVKTSVEASPKMFDLNGDGKEEAIQPTTDGAIHAWQGDGTELKGWPVFSPIRPELSVAGPGNVSKSCAYRTDKTGCRVSIGTLKPEYRELVLGTPAVGDLDGDGKVEVVITTFDGNVLVFKNDGTAFAGFPVHVDRERMKASNPDFLWDDGIFSAPVLADLDKDGKLEIIITAMDQQVYVWRFDGTMQKGFPVVASDPELKGPDGKPTLGDRIITTAAVGDVNGDGLLDIATGTNEALGAEKAKNEARGYVIHGDGNLHAGGPFLPGFPVTTYGLMAYVLPTVGSGVPGNPSLVDIDFDGKLEVNFDTIGSSGTFFTWEGKTFCRKVEGTAKKKCTFDNQTFGPKSNSKDSPAYILIANSSLGKIDPGGGVDFVKATAGFNFALTFASGGTRANFDHSLSAWDTQTGKFLEGWPRIMEDWQFFSNPAIVDIDADHNPEVVAGSAGYLVHAWNYLGVEPKGFPKYTNGWVLTSPAVGDMDGDGNFDVTASTRDGWVFAWKTKGATKNAIVEWQFHGHDLHNTGNYHMPVNPYAKAAPTVDAGGTDAGSDVVTADAKTVPSTTKKPDSGCTAAPQARGEGSLLALGLLLLAAIVLKRRAV